MNLTEPLGTLGGMGRPRKRRSNAIPIGDRPAIGYVRVSTAEQAREGISLDAQRTAVERYAKVAGWGLVEVFADEGISGTRRDRPGLDAALRVATETGAVLIVYRLDRLARSTVHAIEIAERLDRAGADLASVSEDLDTSTACGAFMFRTMASLGQLERDLIAERTRDALAEKRERGERVSRFAPFGYRHEAGRLVEVPEELQTLDRIRYLADVERMNPGQIARHLDANGWRTRNGRPFHRNTIRKILAREAEGIGAR